MRVAYPGHRSLTRLIVLGLVAFALIGSATVAGPVGRYGPSQGSRQTTNLPKSHTERSASGAEITGEFVLPAPGHLGSATTPADCSAHGGFGAGLACKALLPQGRLALIWDYPAHDDVVGFHIYRVDGGQHLIVADQVNGAAGKAYVIDPPPADGYGAACYAVSAYTASEESQLSAPYCGNQARLIQTVTLTPKETLSVVRASDTTSSSPGMNGSSKTDLVDGLAEVGFSYTTDKRKVGFTVADLAINRIHRLGLHFDIAPILHHHIVSARLEMEVVSAWASDDNIGAPWSNYPLSNFSTPTDHSTSCAATLAEGTAKWWKYTDWIKASPALPAAAQGPDVAIDATRIVDGWANDAAPNFGMVLIGEEENLSAFTEKSCVTQYDPSSFKLVIQYY